jgi:hypothetical protein
MYYKMSEVDLGSFLNFLKNPILILSQDLFYETHLQLNHHFWSLTQYNNLILIFQGTMIRKYWSLYFFFTMRNVFFTRVENIACTVITLWSLTGDALNFELICLRKYSLILCDMPSWTVKSACCVCWGSRLQWSQNMQNSLIHTYFTFIHIWFYIIYVYCALRNLLMFYDPHVHLQNPK